jgi:hypothetical protein
MQNIYFVANELKYSVNHSCDPNFTLVFWGRVAVAIASRSIAAGNRTLFDR